MTDRDDRVKRGREYEKLAATFFEQQGYQVLERNWQAGHKEIDLIIRNENQIIFVEVKSSRTPNFGHPAERVDQRKISNLVSAARQYLLAKNISGTDLRFDVVTFSEGRLEHFPNAFPAE